MSELVKEVALFMILACSCVIPTLVNAQLLFNPLEATTITELIEDIIDLVFYAGVAIAPIMFIIAAYYFLTSGGDPNRIQTAKRIILWATVGLLIVLLAKGVISVIRQILSV